jgi:hypothetical protein
MPGFAVRLKNSMQTSDIEWYGTSFFISSCLVVSKHEYMNHTYIYIIEMETEKVEQQRRVLNRNSKHEHGLRLGLCGW